MARKSRKNAGQEIQAVKPAEQIYHCALYARISVENERKRESDTIGNQLQLLRDYASEQSDLEVFDVYVDDNISGVDFVRPEFSRMMNDLRDGRINCIVVKDLSRLGRNYLEAGEYIELVFPFFQCRFIAITDRFDTKYQQADFSVQLKNLANEMYAKDISRKITSAKRTVQEQGKLTTGRAPYGYLVDPADKQHLIVDEETAPIVKELFEMVAAGNTLHAAAVAMNEREVPSPGRLLHDRGMVTTDKFRDSKWYMPTIRRILMDEVYLGWMVSGKQRSAYLSTGQKGTIKVPREEWIITKGTHEPIVTEDLFQKVQEYFVKTKEKHGLASLYNMKKRKASVLTGHLRCGECGKGMYLRQKKNGNTEKSGWYYCPMHENYNSSYCTKKAVRQEDVESLVLKLIQTQIKLFTDSRELCLSLNRQQSSKTKFRIYCDHIREVKGQIAKCMKNKAALYEDYSDGTISQVDYLAMGQQYAQKADELRILLAELETESRKYSQTYRATSSWTHLAQQYQDIDTLTEEAVDAFIDKVTLYNNGHVEVTFHFRDEMDEVIHLAAIRRREAERYVI